MRILNVSLDPQILSKESVAAARAAAYGEAITFYSVIVPSIKQDVVVLGAHTVAYGTGGSTKVLQLWRMFLRARALLRSAKHDVITSQDAYFLGLLAWVLSTRYRCGLEIQAHGIEKQTRIRTLLASFVFSRAHSIRVVSTRLKQELIRVYAVSEDRIVVVPVYVDVSSLQLSQASDDRTIQSAVSLSHGSVDQWYRNRLNILSVGRLVPVKNISMQLQAVQQLRATFPNILLHILGDGPLHTQLKIEIEERGISNHVILHGHVTGQELGVFFSNCDCFIHTAHTEGFGMVLIEAAAAGLPIITTDVGCVGDIFLDKKNCMVVSPCDTNALLHVLTHVLTDTPLRNAIAREALQVQETLPSFTEIIEKYIASWRRASYRV